MSVSVDLYFKVVGEKHALEAKLRSAERERDEAALRLKVAVGYLKQLGDAADRTILLAGKALEAVQQ